MLRPESSGPSSDTAVYANPPNHNIITKRPFGTTGFGFGLCTIAHYSYNI
uniref:Uncharacterized protein n=1 Tax=Arundo donax TaxID=35708 RepID=A0A0A8Y070_ARUDO